MTIVEITGGMLRAARVPVDLSFEDLDKPNKIIFWISRVRHCTPEFRVRLMPHEL
jgi:hypothetical protein